MNVTELMQSLADLAETMTTGAVGTTTTTPGGVSVTPTASGSAVVSTPKGGISRTYGIHPSHSLTFDSSKSHSGGFFVGPGKWCRCKKCGACTKKELSKGCSCSKSESVDEASRMLKRATHEGSAAWFWKEAGPIRDRFRVEKGARGYNVFDLEEDPEDYEIVDNLQQAEAVIRKAAGLDESTVLEGEGFTPPDPVRKAAARGLELRKKAGGKGGLSVKQASEQGIGSGVQRAVNLKNGDSISYSTIKRMKAFFDRHESNKEIGAGKKPHEDKGYVAWLLWGGDPGRSWANKIVREKEKSVDESTVRAGARLFSKSVGVPAAIAGAGAVIGGAVTAGLAAIIGGPLIPAAILGAVMGTNLSEVYLVTFAMRKGWQAGRAGKTPNDIAADFDWVMSPVAFAVGYRLGRGGQPLPKGRAAIKAAIRGGGPDDKQVAKRVIQVKKRDDRRKGITSPRDVTLSKGSRQRKVAVVKVAKQLKRKKRRGMAESSQHLLPHAALTRNRLKSIVQVLDAMKQAGPEFKVQQGQELAEALESLVTVCEALRRRKPGQKRSKVVKHKAKKKPVKRRAGGYKPLSLKALARVKRFSKIVNATGAQRGGTSRGSRKATPQSRDPKYDDLPAPKFNPFS